MLSELHLLLQCLLCLFPDVLAITVTVQVLIVQSSNDTVQPLAGFKDEVRPGERDVSVPGGRVLVRELALEQGIGQRSGDRVEAILLGLAEGVLEVIGVVHVEVDLGLLGHPGRKMADLW